MLLTVQYSAFTVIMLLLLWLSLFFLLLLFVITLTQGIYNNIPEANHISSIYNVAAQLWLQYMVHVMLFSMINVFYFAVVLSEVSPQRPT